VGEHVGLEVLEDLAAVGMRASLLLLGLVARVVTGRGGGDEVADAGAAGVGVHGSGIGTVGEGGDGSSGGLERAVVEEGGDAAVAKHVELGRRGDGGGGGIRVRRLMVREGRVILVMDPGRHGRTSDLGVDQGRVCNAKKRENVSDGQFQGPIQVTGHESETKDGDGGGTR
jgi:hypothetical protein